MDITAGEDMPRHDISLVDLSILRSLGGQEGYEWLKNEERKTISYLLAIRSLMNARVPINRLPEELLGMIILAAAKLVKTSSKNPHNDEGLRPYMWIWFTHVCRQWREAALRQTQLWKFIDVARPDRARFFMQRSKTIPVHVFYHNPAPNLSRAGAECKQKISSLINLIKPNCHRISALSISVPETMMEYAFKGLTFPLPGIRELELTSSKDVQGFDFFDWSPLVYDPVTDTNQHPLRRLSLSGVIIPLSSSYYRGLEELVLCNQYPKRHHNLRHCPTLSTFLDILESCPKLKRMELHRAGPMIETAGTVPKDRLVELPNLLHLSLCKESEDSAPLLSHLKLPSSTTIDINYNFDSQQEVGLFSLFDPRFNRPSFLSSMTKLSILCESDYQDASIFGRSLHSGTLNLYLQWKSSSELHPQKIGQLIRSVPLVFAGSPVKALRIEGDLEEVSLSDWIALFREFSNITSINFSSTRDWMKGWNPEKRFLEALSVCETIGDMLGGRILVGNLLCPKLNTMELGLFRTEPGWDLLLRRCLSSRMEKGASKLPILRLMEPVCLGDSEEWEWPDLTDLCEQFLHPKSPFESE